ncbi:uncharacterized protein L969DRAFT_54485 [Mixia osmundae IAM 14324]|uniref:Signal recognition particle receptor subunit beta n=1 Tax=Mixia osmundae (strain CBS 9802 / IAM 14324 / JCM 22182 / KY 12970) TaxID=764103 RepID=G7E1H9_MIXOS|nr:uncharacterized protein L969DRAFT_54485 [Mixia osmundae IAM 14324]KEI36643.1 hypothetical protein L969DRAFT_54485 [Mixia osmundae IAM 14324]GAA96689.1 hypothetical protein E5Q_03360 [Mixia osmundae IAM 14324]
MNDAAAYYAAATALTILAALLSSYVLRRTAQSATAIKAGTSRRSVVLAGPLEAGKTALWAHLVLGPDSVDVSASPVTVSSLQTNQATLRGSKEPIRIIDTPGHPRLRTIELVQHLPLANAVVFVVDASSSLTGKGLREAGENLHVLLSLLWLIAQSKSVNRQPRLLIALSKTDKVPSSRAEGARLALLERAKLAIARELDRRRNVAAGSESPALTGPPTLTRIEGMDAVPLPTASFLASPFGWLRRPGQQATHLGSQKGLPSDEQDILASDALASRLRRRLDRLLADCSQ